MIWVRSVLPVAGDEGIVVWIAPVPRNTRRTGFSAAFQSYQTCLLFFFSKFHFLVFRKLQFVPLKEGKA